MSIKIKTILIIASLLTAVSTFATRQKADTTYTFRFVPQKDMFYVPLDGNDRELAPLQLDSNIQHFTELVYVQSF